MQHHYKLWQQIEGGLVFISLIGVMYLMSPPFSVWIAVLIFFAPDLSFATYLAGPKVGGFVYNLLHNYGLGAGIILIGVFLTAPHWIFVGLLLVAHCGFDRMLGYGLKSSTAFRETHMGKIGKDA